MSERSYRATPLSILVAVFIWSAVAPHDYFTWILEVFPVLIALPLLLATGRREILLRRSPLPTGKWLFFLVTCVCLAISALYEMLEWWVALASGSDATAFLATQGDVWDTQWDMFLALMGALAALTLLSRRHDRSMAALAT